MKFIEKSKYPLAVVLVWFVSTLCAQTSIAQVNSGLVVTASDDAAFLGQSLFPSSSGDPFQFNSAVLDFGFEFLDPEFPGPEGPFPEYDGEFPQYSSILVAEEFPGGPGEPGPRVPAQPVASIGTFINNTAVYGIGDPGNTVATGIAISSGFVEDYSGGPNFSGSNSGFLGTTASDEQTNLLTDLSPSADGFFQDTTSLSISFTNVTGADQVLDLFAVFGTDETPDFVGTPFNDAFGVFLNGNNIALQNGLPLNVDHPNQLPVVGTELDTVVTSNVNGVTLPYIDLTTTVGSGQHELTIVLGDASDSGFDSTAFLSRDVTTQPVTGVALLPDAISGDGDFVFSDVDLEAGQSIFIDPEIAIGYLYDVEELPGEIESIFDSVRVDPAGTDVDFTISFEDESGATILASLTAGETFTFPTTVDVLSFQILDIDPAQNLPADNPLAFSTLLTFRNDLNGATIIQSPISVAAVPEPSSALLLIISGSVVLLRRRR